MAKATIEKMIQKHQGAILYLEALLVLERRIEISKKNIERYKKQEFSICKKEENNIIIHQMSYSRIWERYLKYLNL